MMKHIALILSVWLPVATLFGTADPFGSESISIVGNSKITVSSLVYALRNRGVPVAFETIGYEPPLESGLSYYPETNFEITSAINKLEQFNVSGNIKDGFVIRHIDCRILSEENIVSVKTAIPLGVQKVFDQIALSTDNNIAIISTSIDPDAIMVPPIDLANVQFLKAASLIFSTNKQIKHWSIIKTYEGAPTEKNNLILIQVEGN